MQTPSRKSIAPFWCPIWRHSLHKADILALSRRRQSLPSDTAAGSEKKGCPALGRCPRIDYRLPNHLSLLAALSLYRQGQSPQSQAAVAAAEVERLYRVGRGSLACQLWVAWRAGGKFQRTPHYLTVGFMSGSTAPSVMNYDRDSK